MIVLPVSEVRAAFETRGQEWLAPSEELERRRLSLEKRHDEWLAGRIAAKRAAQIATGLPFSRLVIRRSEASSNRGQPELRIDDRGPVLGFLSISHSSGYAAAAFDQSPLGIDLERVIDPAPSLIETALSEAERDQLHGLAGPARAAAFTRVWCAKEAYAKWLGRGFALPLQALEPARDERVAIELGTLGQDPAIIWARARARQESCR